MPKAYRYDKDTKIFIGEVERQLDPLESKKAGIDIYLVPGQSTLEPPLPPKDGFDVVWDDDKWAYKEWPKTEAYEPTELELKQKELWETKSQLAQLDYIGVKIATGRATREEYAEQITQMSELADKVNQLRLEIAELGARE